MFHDAVMCRCRMWRRHATRCSSCWTTGRQWPAVPPTRGLLLLLPMAATNTRCPSCSCRFVSTCRGTVLGLSAHPPRRGASFRGCKNGCAHRALLVVVPWRGVLFIVHSMGHCTPLGHAALSEPRKPLATGSAGGQGAVAHLGGPAAGAVRLHRVSVTPHHSLLPFVRY